MSMTLKSLKSFFQMHSLMLAHTLDWTKGISLSAHMQTTKSVKVHVLSQYVRVKVKRSTRQNQWKENR